MPDGALLCFRVADMRKPGVKSRVGVCELCGFKVWIALSSPSAAHVWCARCAREELDQADEDIEVKAPTPEQWADLLRRRS